MARNEPIAALISSPYVHVMKVLMLRLSVLPGIALLSSCQPPPIDISVNEESDRIVLNFSQDWGLIFNDEKVPCIQKVSIQEPTTFEEEHSAWRIEAGNGVQCLDLSSVVVGQVPEGWLELVELDTKPGETYTIWVDGIGWGETDFEF